MQVLIQPDGSLRCVYDEAIDLQALGSVTITRGSHVEPDEGGEWFANLSPVSGPILGPFDHRSQALAAERAWLDIHLSMLSDAS